MTSQPKLALLSPQPYIAIPIEVTLPEWSRAGALFQELFGWLGHRGITPAGPPFYRYWAIGTGGEASFGLEAGVPVPDAIPGDRRVFADTIPGGTYATLVHDGDPQRLFRSSAAVREWAAREGLALDRTAVGQREVWGGLFEFHRTHAPGPGRPAEIAYRVRDAEPGVFSTG